MATEMGRDGTTVDGVLDSTSSTVDPAHDGQVVPGLVSAEISRRMVRLYRDRLGRGPTKSRTTANVNTVMVAFEDTLTTAEQTLLREGKDEHVVSMRQALADTMREDATRRSRSWWGGR